MQVSVNKCQVLTLVSGQSDNGYAYYLSVDEIPIVWAVWDLGPSDYRKFEFNQ